MVGPISSIRTSGIGGVSGTKSGGGKTKAGDAMHSLAGKLGNALADELDLLGDREGRRQYAPDEDLYEIDETARELNSALGGNSAQLGQIARSLGDFVTESASLMAARPESRSLQVIADAITQSESGTIGTETPDSAVQIITRSTALVAETNKRKR